MACVIARSNSAFICLLLLPNSFYISYMGLLPRSQWWRRKVYFGSDVRGFSPRLTPGQKKHVGREWWIKVAHLLVARNQTEEDPERKGPGTRHSPRSCPMIHPDTPRMFVTSFWASLKLVNHHSGTCLPSSCLRDFLWHSLPLGKSLRYS